MTVKEEGREEMERIEKANRERAGGELEGKNRKKESEKR